MSRQNLLFLFLVSLFSFAVIGARTAQAGPTPTPTATPTATPTPTLAPLPQPAQAAFDQKVVARLSAERAVKHVAYLSETIGPRPAGMEGEWQGAAYIASVLESFEYEVETAAFPGFGSICRQRRADFRSAVANDHRRNGLITGEEFVSGELIQVPFPFIEVIFRRKLLARLC